MTTITIRIDETEKEALQEYAKLNDLTVSQVVRRAIRDFFVLEQLNQSTNNIPN